MWAGMEEEEEGRVAGLGMYRRAGPGEGLRWVQEAKGTRN